MSQPALNLVLGLGEIGKPLLEVLSRSHRMMGVDIDPVDVDEPIDVMHICYPFEMDDFLGTTVRYADKYKPNLLIIHSTVQVGTSRRIHKATGVATANSPVRGKHARMAEDLLRYDKFVSGVDQHSSSKAREHFERASLKVRVLSSPEATELAKLTETTYFGLQISWAQDVARLAQESGVSYDEVVSIYDEIDYLPRVKFFPGEIGGHCVMPNIGILKQKYQSDLLNAIETTNRRHVENKDAEPKATQEDASSPLSLQGSGVTLGEDVIIRDFTNLYGCSIGDHSRVGTFVEIQKGANVGRSCKISSHSFICEGVTIEDEVFIGHGVMFTNDLFPRATAGDGALQTDADWECVPTLVKKGASIGSGATILPGVTIGERAIVGAGSVVTRDVPDATIVAGCPAHFIRTVDEKTEPLEVVSS